MDGWMDAWMDTRACIVKNNVLAKSILIVYPSNSTHMNSSARAQWSVNPCTSFVKVCVSRSFFISLYICRNIYLWLQYSKVHLTGSRRTMLWATCKLSQFFNDLEFVESLLGSLKDQLKHNPSLKPLSPCGGRERSQQQAKLHHEMFKLSSMFEPNGIQ